MQISAQNPEHRAKYSVFLDGVDVSDCVARADDVAHEVLFVIRHPDGTPVRGHQGVLHAVGRGQVQIIGLVNRPQVES